MRVLLSAGGVAAGILVLTGAGFLAMWTAARGCADRALRPPADATGAGTGPGDEPQDPEMLVVE